MKNSKNVSFIELSDNEAEMISGGGLSSFIRRVIRFPNPRPRPGTDPIRPDGRRF